MNELRKLAKIKDVADLKDVAVNVAGKVAGQFGERIVKEKIAQLVDKLTAHMNSAIADAGLDPIGIPEFNVSFTAQVACLPLPGSARLHDGGVRGIATVRRHEELTIRVEANSRVFVNLALAIGPVKAGINGDVSICCLGSAPVFSVTCDSLVLRLGFSGDLTERKLTVTEFRIEPETPELRIEVTGVDGGAMRDWIQPLVDKVLETERERLVNATKNKVMELARAYIENPQSLAALL